MRYQVVFCILKYTVDSVTEVVPSVPQPYHPSHFVLLLQPMTLDWINQGLNLLKNHVMQSIHHLMP